MKRYTLMLVLLYVFGMNQAQAQAKIWRSIDLTKFPNTHLTAQDVGFRQLLLQGIQRGKIRVYADRGKFAYFKKRIPRKQTSKVLKYYDTGLQEMVELRPDDFSVLEIQELYDPTAKQQYQIQAIVLKAPEFSKSMVIKYKHFKKYLNKIYKRTRRQKDLMVLKAYWQSPEDNTLQVSVPAALEQRKFLSKILKTDGLTAQAKANLKKSQKYSPIAMTSSEILQAPFLRVNEQTLQATTRYQIDLRKATNAAFYQNGNGLVKVILQGIKKGKIKPYQYASTPRKYFKRLKKKSFLGKLQYYDAGVADTINIRPADLYKMEVVGHWVVNVPTKQSSFKIYQINFLIPKGTNEQTELGDLRLAQLKYRQVKAYLAKRFRKAKKRGRRDATWVNPDNKQMTMGFDEALDKGLYDGDLAWFANQQDMGVLFLYDTIAQRKDHVFKNIAAARKYAQQYLEKYPKE